MNLWDYIDQNGHGTAAKIQTALGSSKNYLWHKRKSGKGFTEEQAEIIRRFTQGVVTDIPVQESARPIIRRQRRRQKEVVGAVAKVAVGSATAAKPKRVVVPKAAPAQAPQPVQGLQPAVVRPVAATEAFKHLLRRLAAKGLGAADLLDVIERLDRHLSGAPEPEADA